MFPKGSYVEGLILSWWSWGEVVKTKGGALLEEVGHWRAPLKDRLSLDVPLLPGCYEVSRFVPPCPSAVMCCLITVPDTMEMADQGLKSMQL